MIKFFNTDMADLAQQLTLSPRRLRIKQIHGIEKLLGLIEADQSYPFEFVCYHITGYRKRGADAGCSVPAKALIHDLVMMAEFLSRKSDLSVSELNEPYQTHQETADALGVSTKTIRRWRDRGLMGIRVVYADGVNRLAFLQQTVERFVDRNKRLVAKGASFQQLTIAERRRIVERARELTSSEPLKLHAASRIIAEEIGRAVETVRYTLRRYDHAHPDSALFTGNGSIHCERHLAIWQCHEAGESNASIADAFDCSVEEVEQVFRVVQVQKWARMKWDHVHHELFDASQADALILDIPEPAGDGAASPSVPRDLPPYLRSLYHTPLLTTQQEQDVFRRYNYLKFKVGKALQATDPLTISVEAFDALRKLVEQVESTRQRIIQANLRLVVSITRRHVGWSFNFFEVVSDGNMSLMRAVEKFDFSRDVKFSTYATWAISKNYARTLPQQYYRNQRYVTGQDEVIESTPGKAQAVACDADRRQVRVMIEAGMNELSDREREIIRSHFGLNSGKKCATLEQLGKRFGVTKERIRQIERRALSRLRELLSPSLVDAL